MPSRVCESPLTPPAKIRPHATAITRVPEGRGPPGGLIVPLRAGVPWQHACNTYYDIITVVIGGVSLTTYSHAWPNIDQTHHLIFSAWFLSGLKI